jgi:hypothetical protein
LPNLPKAATQGTQVWGKNPLDAADVPRQDKPVVGHNVGRSFLGFLNEAGAADYFPQLVGLGNHALPLIHFYGGEVSEHGVPSGCAVVA